MNNKRRDLIYSIIEKLESLRGDIEEIQLEEQDAFDGMPDNLQQSERGQTSERAAGELQTAADYVQEVIDNLQSSIE